MQSVLFLARCQGLGVFPELFIVRLQSYMDRSGLHAGLSCTEDCKYVITAFSCFYAAISLELSSNLAQTEV